MNIGMVGISHDTAPIEVRERFSFTERQKVQALSDLTRTLPEAIILATCNRTEVYFAGEDVEAGAEKVRSYLKDYARKHKRVGEEEEEDPPLKNLDDHIYSHTGRACADHLFLVAGGLDSQVIGEDQILGQVKDALEFCLDLKFSGKFLNRLFMNALSLGKKIRSSLHISEIPLSTSYIGIRLLNQALGTFEGKTLLLVGAGQISQLSLKYLAESGLDQVYMTNRHRCRLVPFQKEYEGLKVVDYDDRYKVLEEADALISATAAPHYVIHKEDFPKLHKPLYIMDLALPKDVDPAIGDMDWVKLYNLDDLTEISETNKQKRENLAGKARAMIEEDTGDYMTWLATSPADPYIGSLAGKIEEIQSDSMDFIRRKLDLTSREDKMVSQLLSYALHRLSRDAVLSLKNPENIGNEAYRKVARDFLGLDKDDPDQAEDEGDDLAKEGKEREG